MSRQTYIAECRKLSESTLLPGRTLVQYIRNKKNGTPKGVVIAFRDPKTEVVKLGWSLCNKNDKYNKYIGLSKAIDRASYVWNNMTVAETVIPIIKIMEERIEKFFYKVNE